MKTLKKLASTLLLAFAVILYSGCSPEDPENGGGNNGGENNGDTPGQTDGPIHLPRVITEDMDLQDLGYDIDYIIDDGLTIAEDALVTVGPGVTIRVEGPDSWGDVKGILILDNAALKMRGTAEKPIRFVGHEGCGDNERTWLSILIRSNTPENQWEYVEIHNAGGETIEHPAVWLYGSLAMRNCTIDGSNSYGIGLMKGTDLQGVLTDFSGNTIKNCDLGPLYVEGYDVINCLTSGNTYINDNNYVTLASGAGITHVFEGDVRFRKLEIPYYFMKKQEWMGTGTAIIDPGVEMLFERGALETYSVSVKAIGTAEEPIVFRARDPQAYWGGLILSNSEENIVTHCKFKNGGPSSSNSGYLGTTLLNIGSNCKLTMTDNIFESSRYYGVTITDIKTFDNVTHSGTQFGNCEVSNVHIIYGGEYHGVVYSDANGNMDLNSLP